MRFIEREEIGRDGEDDGAEHPPERARDHARGEEPLVALGEAAEQGAHNEAAVEEQQEPIRAAAPKASLYLLVFVTGGSGCAGAGGGGPP